MECFSNETINKIGYYVYRLIDPRNGETFYVGKGKGNRIFDHVKCSLKENLKSDKLERIRLIQQEGLEVLHIIQRWGLTEEEAFKIEATVMDCFPGLENNQSGRDNEHGVTSAIVLNRRFTLKPYEEPDFNYILIKIRQWRINEFATSEDPIYEAVRYAWKLNLSKANKCKYVFAVLDGVVMGVYEVDHWDKTEDGARLEFKGHKVPELEKKYKNITRIPDIYTGKGMANPALYGKNNKY